jgi:hypothetical protein
VNATPTFFVGALRSDGSIELVKRVNGAVTFDDFVDVLADVSKVLVGRL